MENWFSVCKGMNLNKVVRCLATTYFVLRNFLMIFKLFFLSLESKTVFSVMASARRHECVGVEDEIQASSHLISECPFCEVNDASKSWAEAIDSVTRLGNFGKFLVTSFLSRVAQLFGDYLDHFKNGTLFNDNHCGNLFGNFKKIWATFNFNNWPHWPSSSVVFISIFNCLVFVIFVSWKNDLQLLITNVNEISSKK